MDAMEEFVSEVLMTTAVKEEVKRRFVGIGVAARAALVAELGQSVGAEIVGSSAKSEEGCLLLTCGWLLRPRSAVTCSERFVEDAVM